MKNLFVIILRYLVPIEAIDQHRAEHLNFLDKHYDSGMFIASGRQTPASGGVILAAASNRYDIEKVIDKDPFKIHGLAAYQVFEFTPNKYSKSFTSVISEITAD